MSFISDNFMPFYWIWVGFSLKIIVLIREHCYTNVNINIQILNFGAEFERCFKQCAFLSYVSFEVFYISL